MKTAEDFAFKVAEILVDILFRIALVLITIRDLWFVIEYVCFEVTFYWHDWHWKPYVTHNLQWQYGPDAELQWLFVGIGIDVGVCNEVFKFHDCGR